MFCGVAWQFVLCRLLSETDWGSQHWPADKSGPVSGDCHNNISVIITCPTILLLGEILQVSGNLSWFVLGKYSRGKQGGDSRQLSLETGHHQAAPASRVGHLMLVRAARVTSSEWVHSPHAGRSKSNSNKFPNRPNFTYWYQKDQEQRINKMC